MVNEQLAKTAYLAGDAFSYGDIPVAIMAYRYRQLVPERPPLPNFERWYAPISARQAFKDHVAAVPLRSVIPGPQSAAESIFPAPGLWIRNRLRRGPAE